MAINLMFAVGGTDSSLSFGSTYCFYYDSMNITYRYSNEIDRWEVVRSILDLVETCMGAVFERDGKGHRGSFASLSGMEIGEETSSYV